VGDRGYRAGQTAAIRISTTGTCSSLATWAVLAISSLPDARQIAHNPSIKAYDTLAVTGKTLLHIGSRRKYRVKITTGTSRYIAVKHRVNVIGTNLERLHNLVTLPQCCQQCQSDDRLPTPLRSPAIMIPINCYSYPDNANASSCYYTRRLESVRRRCDFVEQQSAPIVVITAADTDIQTLAAAVTQLPADFPPVRG
jgi:hypothetical protein